ncbi:hypothetical protein LWM68_41215 [Niabella sp. W65]|nr:hypothetical protein [Niabella sp. W65]MCH7368593.1 hypothetical protein [Niabella sp. W65]ULT44179.1 hypothetical protein KRR40_12910 [Niabella sp. I65]
MPNQYLDTTLLKKGFDRLLKQRFTDNEKENVLFDYPIDVLEDLLTLYQSDEQYETCQLIKNVLSIKNDPPVGTILNYDQVQAIYDNAVHPEFKNQLKAVLVSVKITSDQYNMPLENFSFVRDDNGYIRVKDIRE